MNNKKNKVTRVATLFFLQIIYFISKIQYLTLLRLRRYFYPKESFVTLFITLR